MTNLLLFPDPEPQASEPQITPIPDAVERDLALDITRSFIVEAPAGSGKTGLLIQRLLKLLAHESVTDPTQVLAITFTRKATHEMRDRVLRQLTAAHHNLPATNDFDRTTRPLAEAALAHDRRLGWSLLEHPDRLNISTIDAFCAQIARSLPVLSGMGGQTPVEDANEFYADAARRTLTQLGGANPVLNEALRTLLLHRDGNLAECESLIAKMLNWRDQWGNLVPLTGEQLTEQYLETVTLPKLEAALEQAICRALAHLAKLMPPAILDRLSVLAAEMAHAEGYKGSPSPIAICKNRNQSPADKADDLEHWSALAGLLVKSSEPEWRVSLTRNRVGFEILKHHQSELENIIAEISHRQDLCAALCAISTLPPLKYPPEQWRVAKALFRVLSHALVELQFVFEARGECDFTQFSLIARQALHSDAALDDLSAAAGLNLQHLLVDEMQDTSSSQYELIRLLTRHWDGGSQTVFLVGDPKQSIYLFRQARVERFIDTLRTSRLGDLPLTPLFLTANFRSQGDLVQAFNQTFSQIFPNVEDVHAEAVPYRSASSIHPAIPGPTIAWHTQAIPSDTPDQPEAQRLQHQKHAFEIRTLVEEWRSRPLPPGREKPWEIAVLVRNRKHLLHIVRAFKAEPSIPFRAVKTEPLGERQEVLDLLALTRALLHPADRTAWLALMRTPWCGLTLRDLHLLAGEEDLRELPILDLITLRGDLLSEDGLARLQPFWTVMAAALAQRGRLSLSQWVSRTWKAFNAQAFALPDELANTERFFQLLDDLDARPTPLSIDHLKKRIDALYAAESTQPHAVDLMTIHNAKGLEWDFVVVPQLESGSRTNASNLLDWIEIESGTENDPTAAHGVLAPVHSKGTDRYKLSTWIRSIHSAREAAERKRLFYVACTRARQELHLFAAPRTKQSGEISRIPDSLLAAAWPAAATHFPAPRLAFVSEEPGEILEMAAAGIALVPTPTPRTIQRIPLQAFPASTLRPLATSHPDPEMKAFTRPEGSFEARAFGNATHTFLEALAQRLATGAIPTALLAELPTWSLRIASVLRAEGLAAEATPRAAANVLRGLTQTLNDPDGLWLLYPHPEAASESSITTASGTLRLDRTFLAGATPRDPASTHLWIVDFKTASHGEKDLAAFLAREQEKYLPQLETYATHLAQRGLPMRLALYYPMIPKLLWWPGSIIQADQRKAHAKQ